MRENKEKKDFLSVWSDELIALLIFRYAGELGRGGVTPPDL